MSSSPAVRTFRRSDRHQLTDLVNRHAAAVLPGVSTSVNTVLSSLEERPDEYVVDPWVAERLTLVTEHHGRVVAAAHLHRYRDEPDVGPDYRGAAVVQWVVHHPGDGIGPGSAGTASSEAADLLLSACLATATRWQARGVQADGALPCPGVYGIPAVWPHVRSALERAGFVHTGATEVLLLAEVRGLPDTGQQTGRERPTLLRTLGSLGTRFTAFDGDRVLGHLELDTTLDRPERVGRGGGLAELADVDVDADAPEGAEQTLARLLAEARDWLTLCGIDRLITCAYSEDVDEIDALHRHGFREVTRTARGWELRTV
ncbi:N-acetyltransferase [Streptomyces parvus]|uniref:N-acetyltransferase n=1 Tax=Streptomyces parvus TaxID=66428 RepID=UPI002101589E|nr:N-acetyltransferase [Streptomyces parvus]MCQ1578877.1 N-acetyltransferase [Streptomyces parvus]